MQRTPFMWDVVEEELDEAAFLWTQWHSALESPLYRPEQVASGLEERLLRHLDALKWSGAEVLEQLVEELSPEKDPEKSFPLGFALFELCENGDVESALTALQRLLSREDLRPMMAQALGLCRGAQAAAIIERLLESDQPIARVVALDAAALRGLDVGKRLRASLKSTDTRERAAALRAARYRGEGVRDRIEAGLLAPQGEVRDAAMETALISGFRSAYSAAVEAVDKRTSGNTFPMIVLALSGDLRDLDRLVRALEQPAARKAALWALGASGWPGAAEQCLPFLSDEKLARCAGEAFSAITGLTLAGPFALEEQDDDELGSLEEEGAELVPGPERALPLPDPDEIALWWEEARHRFDPAARYLAGTPREPEWMVEALKTFPMRRRPPIALELAVRSRGELRLETRSWVREQLQELSAHRLTHRSGFGAPFSRLLQG